MKREQNKPNVCPCCGETSVYGEDETCENCLSRPEPEQDEIMRQFEKCWHGVFDHLDKMLLIEITDVFRSGYKSGYTSRNAEIEVKDRNIKQAFSTLSLYGVPEGRAKTVANGISVLATRYNKEIEALKAEIESTRCCGNCGNRKNRICNIKSEIPLGEDVCNNWTRRTK